MSAEELAVSEELAEEVMAEEAPPRRRGRWLWLLIICAGLGAGGWFAWDRLGASDPAAAEEGRPVPRGQAHYLALEPPLVINFAAGGELRYLQVAVELMSTQSRGIDVATRHVPALRHTLITLFSERDYAALLTRDGKEELRQEALAAVRAELQMLAGQPAVDDVYFTSFVMQ